MTDVNEVLAKLTEARRTYAEYVAAVDADLRKERQRRLALRTGEILDHVARAYAMGASKRSIMRAYDTKDFRTIDNMISTMEEQITLIKQEIEAEQNPVASADWFELVERDRIWVNQVEYTVIELEGNEYMLDGPGLWDASILDPTVANDTDDAGILYRAIHERWTNG